MTFFGRTGTMRRTLMVLAAALLASACAEQRSPSVLVVYAASSMQRAVEVVARDFRRAGGDSVVLVWGSTTDLAEQIVNGAPADVILAADEHTINRLAERQQLIDSTRVVYAIGQLALVTRCAAVTTEPTEQRPCTALSLDDLARPDVRFVAIANPAYAPYGVAAQQTLERLGLWSRVQRKLVMGANIAQADQFVTSGNADAGLVALSLVLGAARRVFVPVDPQLHEPLRHTAAVVRSSHNVDGASRLLRYIMSASGQAVLVRYGFVSPDSLATR